MTSVSLRDFRENQRAYFDLADKGEQVIIKRGKQKKYFIVPVDDDDFVLTPELEARTAEALREYERGETYRMLDGESLTEFLNRTRDV